MHASSNWSGLAVMVLLAALPLQTGCSFLLGTKQDPVRLYVLTAQPPAASSAAETPGLELGFGPVTLPGYLDRQGIVTRVAANRLEASRNDLWAEPLGVNFRDVLAQDLRFRLTGATIRSFPWSPNAKPALSVAVEVWRFEATESNTAELHARWTLKDDNDAGTFVSREATLTQRITGSGAEATVAALADAIATLSDEIAAEVAARTRTSPAKSRPTKR